MTNDKIVGLFERIHGKVEEALKEALAEIREADRTGYIGDLYRTDYEVEGSGEFPYDMLRYACSYPCREEDSYAMGADREQKRVVRLSRYHRDRQPQLGEVRWESKFRWKIVRVVETVKV